MAVMTVTMTMKFDTEEYSDVRDVRGVLQLARSCIEGQADFPDVVRISACNEKTNAEAWVDHHTGSDLTAVKSPAVAQSGKA